MKVAACGLSSIKCDYHGRPCNAHVRNVSAEEGKFLESAFVRDIGANVAAPRFCIASRVRSFSTINSQRSISPIKVASLSKANGTSRLEIQATETCDPKCGTRNRTVVARRSRIKSSLSFSRGWKQENQSISTMNCPIDVSCGRPCAAVTGEADVVARRESSEQSIYRPFVDFAVEELSKRADVSPLLLKEEFRNMVPTDNTATIDNMAFKSPKIRVFRIASIETTSAMQVLNVAGFASPEFDLPIFCADFFSMPNKNIVVLDLNPLYNTNFDMAYKERYYDDLMPLANKYLELLPWGDKLTTESLQFFSPLVIWTKAPKQDLTRYLYPAFQDYLVAWLNMVDAAHPSFDALAIARNKEAQHRYISWRVTKDPGRPLLTKLYGEQLSESYIKEFLFSGINTLGTKSFVDYFPEYRNADGAICKQRSMIGKSFDKRPWDKQGSFCPS